MRQYYHWSFRVEGSIEGLQKVLTYFESIKEYVYGDAYRGDVSKIKDIKLENGIHVFLHDWFIDDGVLEVVMISNATIEYSLRLFRYIVSKSIGSSFKIYYQYASENLDDNKTNDTDGKYFPFRFIMTGDQGVYYFKSLDETVSFCAKNYPEVKITKKDNNIMMTNKFHNNNYEVSMFEIKSI